MDDELERIAERFRRFSADTAGAGWSRLYERLAARCAEAPDVLALMLAAPPEQRLPTLLLAAVHDEVLRDPSHPLAAHYPDVAGETDRAPDADPWRPFKALVAERADVLRERIATRRTQTNETGRCAGLLPAFGEVAQFAGGRPLALIEIGASAGLNLNWDRYAYAYARGDGAATAVAGAPGAVPTLRCRLRRPDPPPLPDPFPEIVSRVGVDLDPPDLDDPDDVRWLRACVFPDQPERVARLEAALAVAAEHRPRVLRGQALDLLPDLIAAAPSDAAICVFHTALVPYLRRAEVERLRHLLRAHDVLWVAGEHPGSLLPGRGPVWGEFHVTVGRPDALALRARMGPHGQWLEWPAAAD